MGYYEVEITPHDIEGNYSEPVDVTQDVDLNSFSSISRQIENSEYDVGLFGYDNVSLGVRNEHGRFSDVDVDQSVFRFKRGDSIVQFFWRSGPPAYLGSAIAGQSVLGPRIELFGGLLNDDAATMAIDRQKLSFKALGLESVLSRVLIPAGLIENGDLLSEAILKILNQQKITNLLTVSAENISLAVDVPIDDATKLSEKAVKATLDDLLFLSNSVMYLDHRTIHIKPRSGPAEIKKTFYGQASNNGIENIVQIDNIRKGLNRTFNRWTWKDSLVVSQDIDSIDLNGLRSKEIESEMITNPASQQLILNALNDEFKDPKMEFNLTTRLTGPTLSLTLLDGVAVDYPTVAIGEEGEVPVYGLSTYGNAVYPKGVWSLTVSDQQSFKIMGISLNIKDETIVFRLKEVI